MADNLPAPESRVESYLAKAAGEDVTIPEKPLSRLEQYLDAIAEGGGGGGGPTVVQTTGTSTTDVMSQNAVFGMIVADTNAATPYDRIQIGGTSKQNSVSIGRSSLANSSSVSVGKGAGSGSSSSASYNTDIGYNAGANKGNTVNYSVSLGSYSQATKAGEVNIGTGTRAYGYNSTSYRLLTGVHDPVDAHDAATKGYVDSNAGGPTVVQTTGNSTTDVMSQDATTSMVYGDPTTKQMIRIGDSAAASTYRNIAIGYYTQASKNYSVAVGAQSAASGQNSTALGPTCIAANDFSVALGYNAVTTRNGEVNIGGTVGTGYADTNYRVLGGVHDGQLAQDAVTVNQVNSVIDAINTALSTNIPHIGATS